VKPHVGIVDGFLYQQHRRFYAQVAGGLEELAGAELKRLGATRVKSEKRGVIFSADPEALCRINYRARLVSRVLAPLVEFPAHTPEELYLGAKQVDWTQLLRLDQTFAIFANVHQSRVSHSKYAALKVKDCVVDMFRKRYGGKRPDVDPQEPDLWLAVHVLRDQATIFLDCSGGSLHRRGYRLEAVEAPMQETLAAAILDLAGWDGKRPLYDPMCGSGTLLAEAWLKAGNISAGCLRGHWGFEMLPDHDKRTWFKVKLEEDNAVRAVRGGLIRGSDLDPAAVEMTRRNLARIPSGDELRVKTCDFRDLDGLNDALIVCNPPYGMRLQPAADIKAFLGEFGDFLKRKCTGSDAWVYVGDNDLVGAIGLKPAVRKPLRNGGLDGRLLKFELY
jgi:putative N6-adenine-specific DNA methylase